jgi:PPP family 3-phenylpropionic acid transporter
LQVISLPLFYFSYFAILGLLLPYFNLYLAHLGLSGRQIGLLLALLPGMRLLAPVLWGVASDRFGIRRGMTLWSSGLGLLAFAGFLWVEEYGWMLVVMALFSSFWGGALPLVEATTLERADREGGHYGRIRLWGSIGFIVFAVLFGYLLDVAPIRLVLYGILALLFLNLASTWGINHPQPAPHSDHTLRTLFMRREVFLFLLCGFLMQLSHGTYYGFFSLYLEGLGYSHTEIGALWVVGVLSEIVILYRAGWLQDRLGLRGVLGLSLLLAALRWGATGLTEGFLPLFLAQILHAFSFGAFHAAAVTYTYQVFPPRYRASGQSLYSSASFGLGLVIGLAGNGLLYEPLGPKGLFLASGGIALAALLLIPALRSGQQGNA